MTRGVGALMPVIALALGACSKHGLVTEEGSVSWGGRVGVLFQPAALPETGAGYWIPPIWKRRGLRYGTDELVSMVVHAGRELSHERPGARFGVADLSRRSGGPSRWHRSHQGGRDVDLIFVVHDGDGNPVSAERMHRYGADGAVLGGGGEEGEKERALFFDDAGNWVLVRSLIQSPVAEVQWIFLSDDLKQRLLDHARSIGEPRALIQQAGYLLHQPSDSLKHDDHMHVRIYCAPSDIARGCRDFGSLRWIERDYKYDRRVRREMRAARLASVLFRPFRLLMGLASLPVRGFVPRR